MTTMIERVAQAISDATGWTEEGSYDTCCTQPIDAARAAIAAMREPTEAMMEAHTSTNCVECWQAMIDAALKET